jgi:hypothetical protein
MLRIDNSLLQEVGLAALPDSEKNSLLKHIYETLEMRVGVRLAGQMSNEQLDEFERYFEAKDDEGAFKWLEGNFPNYKDIVQEEFDKLKVEIAQSAPQILEASPAVQQPPVQQQTSNEQSQTPSQNYTPEDPQQIPATPANYNQQPPTQVPLTSDSAPHMDQSANPDPQQPPASQPDYSPQRPPAQTSPNPQTFDPPYPSQQPPAGPTPPNQY